MNFSHSSASVTGPAWPIRFAYCDKQGKFQMDPKAVAALQLLKGPISVVCIWGCTQQEKSLISKQLLGKSTHQQCREEGIWLMSEPVKRRAPDGIEYNLLCLDCEESDVNDQTGDYRKHIFFSVAILLSTVLIYNQVGGIGEASLGMLSRLTEKAKDIRVGASELGQISPMFVWLLRDFCLDAVGDNREADYLKNALRPVQGMGEDIAAKNKMRDSIRDLFPNRKCFTLVQDMDIVTPELEALTTAVFERRPKQVGATVLTGPVLPAITESYLDALNDGKVPKLPSSWRIVAEVECRTAYDSATEVYLSTLSQSKPLEETGMMEVHAEAVRKSLAAFNVIANDSGSARERYEGCLIKFHRRAFEEYKMNANVKADSQCSQAIRHMSQMLRKACHGPDARIDKVVEILCALSLKYVESAHGPSKCRKLAMFLQESWDKPIQELAKRQIDSSRSECTSLMLECQAIEDEMMSLITIESKLKAGESKMKYDVDTMNLKNQIRALSEKLETKNEEAQSYQTECLKLEQKLKDGLPEILKDLINRNVGSVPN